MTKKIQCQVMLAVVISLASAVVFAQSESEDLKAAISQSDPRAKAAALESFLRTYPQSADKKGIFNNLIITYRSLNDNRNAFSAAKRGLQVYPNDENLIFFAVESGINECNRTGDAKTCNDVAALGQRGLSIVKSPAYTDDTWNKTIAVTYPYFRSAIALVRPEPPDTPKMTNNEVIQLATAGLSDQVVATSIRQASNKDFDLSITGLIALKKAGVSDAVILVMQEKSHPPQLPSTSPPTVTPPQPSNGCEGIEAMGLFKNNTGVAGLIEWLAQIRNNGGVTKIVIYGWMDQYGQQQKGQVQIQGGQISSIRLDLTQNMYIPPVRNLQLISCQ